MLGSGGFKVGIVWQGNPVFKNDRRRSVPLENFAPLSAIPDVRLISLQAIHGLDQLTRLPGMNVEILGAKITDNPEGLDEIAAVMMNLDLVVTSDTAAGTYSHRIQVREMPFKVTANKWTATAGTTITWTVNTAETQTGWVTLSVKQPGLAKYSVSLAKWSDILYKGSFTLKSGGTLGAIVLTLVGTDTGGGIDAQVFTITLN